MLLKTTKPSSLKILEHPMKLMGKVGLLFPKSGFKPESSYFDRVWQECKSDLSLLDNILC